MTEEIIEIEFSRVIDVPKIVKTQNGQIAIEASAEECSKLSDRFGFEKIESLSLKGEITPQQGSDMFDFKATLESKVGVIDNTGKNVFETICEDIHVILAPDNDKLEQRMDDIDIDIEPMDFGKVDFGELAAQYMFLLVDSILLEDQFQDYIISELEKEGGKNPFANLDKLLKDKNN